MNEYMITISFISSFSDEFISLIAQQRMQVDDMMEKGIITSYSLSADRGTMWIAIIASSYEEIRKTLQSMPLHKFMRYDITELLFHNSPVNAQIRFSVN
jgi:hypothetical protein